MTPRFHGTPSAKAAAAIRSREDFVQALRANDQDSLLSVKTAGQAFGFIDIPGGIQTHQFEGFASYLDAATKRVWATARAIDLVAGVVLSTDMQIVNRDTAIRSRKKPVRVDPDLAKLLANPNQHDTISEMLYLWVAHMKSCGNALWFKDQMNAYGQPLAIYALNPKNIRIVPHKKDRISHYLYCVGGAEIRIERDEMIHFKRPHADNVLWGLGEIEQGEGLYNEFINRTLHNTKLIANGSSPSSVLVNETFQGEQEEWERMQAKFHDKFGGVKNTGKVAWMNGKWSLLQLGVDAQKMQEMEKAKTNKEDIFLNHGIPLSVAGYPSANYATAKQEDINFRKYGVLPLLNMFIDAINSPRGLIAAYHVDLKLDFSLAGLIDVKQIMEEFGPLFDRGCITGNQLREKAGLPREENALLDSLFIKSDYMPLEMAGLADVPPPVPPTKPAVKPGADSSDNAQNV